MSRLTKGALIQALEEWGQDDDIEVLFSVPDADDMPSGECVQTLFAVHLETAHDDDCTEFLRVVLIDPALLAEEG